MIDFGQWMNRQAPPKEPEPEDQQVHLTCAGCGKVWYATRRRVDNGDECAFVLVDEGDELEVYCGGSVFCTP